MKKILKLCLCIITLLISIYVIYHHYDKNDLDEVTDYVPVSKEQTIDEVKIVSSLKEKYKNDEIEFFLEIPDVLAIPIVKTTNNEYYLTHDIEKQEKETGWPFLDYRNTSLEDQKLIVYGHNSTKNTLPFTSLVEYQDEDFFIKHPNIYLYTDNEKRTYKIFSSYVETEDFDYINLTDFNNLTYYEHLLKLKSKSLYDTEVMVNENSKIIILQTCTFNTNYNGDAKYQLVMGVLVEE